jgi:ribosomal subunit interface protein
MSEAVQYTHEHDRSILRYIEEKERPMELQIDGQQIDVTEDLRIMITDHMEKLNTHHEDIIHARVSLVKSTHHQQGSDEARIILAMTRRKHLQATRVGKTVEDAFGNAIDALHRELAAYRGKRREIDKPRLKTAKAGPQLSGIIVQIFPEQGYGFVDLGLDEEVHFLRQAVVGDAFESLTEGMPVDVDVVENAGKYQAVRVAPLPG